MNQRPAAAHPELAHGEFVVVESKFHPPPVHPEQVVRPRLRDALAAGASRRLTLVDAPAGSGKSRLLAAWCQTGTSAGRCAWLALDALDDDPTTFWTYLVEALRHVAPDGFEVSRASLRVAGVSLTRVVLPQLLNELWALDQPLTLVLDDYHVIHAIECHESLLFFLRRLPPQVRLVIATRSDPPLGLSQLRARGELCELRAADLAFTGGEAETLLNDTLGLELDGADVERLQARTEGWAAGLYLAALSLRARATADRSAFIAAFAGDNRQIVAYLGDEVLHGLPADTRAFLVQTSILERFSASLCDAVLGRSGSARSLDTLAQTNGFVIPLDARGGWYRYHHLFQDLLQLELRQTQPDLVPVLHGRAARWYAAAGEIGAAMEHALAAADSTLAADLFLQHALPLLWAGRLATVTAWLDALPIEETSARPALALASAWIVALSGGTPAELDARLVVTADGREDEPLLLGEPSVAAAAALVRATHPVADVGAAVTAAEAAVAAIRDPTTTAYLLAQVALGRAYYLAGRAADAQAPLEAALQAPLAPRQVVGTSRALATLALVCLELGEEARAGELARRAVQLCEERNLASGPSAWLTYLALATVLARDGRLDQADAVIAHSVEPQLEWLRHWPLFAAMALLGIASVRAACGQGRAAHGVLDEARAVLAGCADPGMLPGQLTTIERRLQRPLRQRTGLIEDLTDGELRVLRLLASDLSQREIGRELDVSVNTIKSHTRTLYAKLGISSRTDAIRRARELALIA